MKTRKILVFKVSISIPIDGSINEARLLIKDLLIHSSNSDAEPDRVKVKRVIYVRQE